MSVRKFHGMVWKVHLTFQTLSLKWIFSVEDLLHIILNGIKLNWYLRCRTELLCHHLSISYWYSNHSLNTKDFLKATYQVRFIVVSSLPLLSMTAHIESP